MTRRAERPMSMDEAADALNVSRRWLQDFIQKIPPCWLAAGNRKLFDEHSIYAIKEDMRCRSNYSPPAKGRKPPIRYAEPISGSTSNALAERLRKRPRNGSLPKSRQTSNQDNSPPRAP